MANPWDPDVQLDEEAARRLIERQFPRLAPAALERFGQGWDNDAWLVNGAFVFRFPRRKLAAEICAHEVAVLPAIASRLPVPVPNPCFVGVPEEGYPYPFAGYARIPGRTADGVPLDDEDRERLAPALGAFLRTLHGTPPPTDTPPDLIGRADLARNVERLEGRLALLEREPTEGVSAADVLSRARELSAAKPHEGALRLVHGDLYARHLLLDDEKRLCGVIDWGDVHAGDPALDLSAAFALLPPTARAAFFAAYGAIDNDTEARARFRALYSGTMLVHYGRSVGDVSLAKAGEVALRFALS